MLASGEVQRRSTLAGITGVAMGVARAHGTRHDGTECMNIFFILLRDGVGK